MSENQKNSTFFIGIMVVMLVLIAIFVALSFQKWGGDHDLKKESNKHKNKSSIIYNDYRNGEVRQVKDFLLHNLNDPDSLKFEFWGKVQEIDYATYIGKDEPGILSTVPKGYFLVRCRYRAKNLYGGMILKDEVFFLSPDGMVVAQRDNEGGTRIDNSRY